MGIAKTDKSSIFRHDIRWIDSDNARLLRLIKYLTQEFSTGITYIVLLGFVKKFIHIFISGNTACGGILGIYNLFCLDIYITGDEIVTRKRIGIICMRERFLRDIYRPRNGTEGVE